MGTSARQDKYIYARGGKKRIKKKSPKAQWSELP
jgi:hypothetical protein